MNNPLSNKYILEMTKDQIRMRKAIAVNTLIKKFLPKYKLTVKEKERIIGLVRDGLK